MFEWSIVHTAAATVCTQPRPYQSPPNHHNNQNYSGVICTTDESVRGNIVQAVAMPGGQRIFPVGRLDKESTGLVCACIVCVCVLCVCFGGAGGDGAMQSLLTGSANTYTYK